MAAIAAIGCVALLVAGCTSGTKQGAAAASAITIATSAPLTSSNSQSLAGDLPTNQTIGYLTSSWFSYYSGTPRLLENTDFGTQTVLGTSPLTVRYTIKRGVTWSDGTPVTAADLLLDWASSISRYNAATGVNFTSAHAGSPLDLVTKTPTISSDGSSMTVVFSQPDVDWQSALPAGMLAAHAVYRLAFPGTKPATANRKVIAAITGNDTATLTALAKAWSTGFALTGMPGNKSLLLSDGAFRVSSIASNESITLAPNRSYHWGPHPSVSKVTFRILQSPESQVQAVQAGSVDLISGLTGFDLGSVAAAHVTAQGAPTGNYEHIDLTMNNGGPFDKGHYKGSAAKALEVRQAFLEALPRAELLDKLVHPIAPGEKLDDSQVLLPGAAGYAASVAANGSSAYDSVDIAGAKALLAAAGTPAVKVRLLYAKSDIMRSQEVALITSSEAKAGITVVPEANDSWPDLLGNGSYDAVLFAWDFTSLDVTATAPIFRADASQNFTGYNDAATNSDLTTLASSYGAAEQLKLLADVDKNAWGDAYGATLYQLPVVNAWSKALRGVRGSPLAPGVFWNVSEWSIARVSH